MAKSNSKDAARKLGRVIKGIRIAMLTTVDTDNHVRARPMATMNRQFDGSLYFFTALKSGKVDAVEHEQQVNLSYVDADAKRFASVAGRATVTQDHALMKKLWTPEIKAWFPKGLGDPNLALLKVDVEDAEIWEGPTAVVRVFKYALALLTGRSAKDMSFGEHLKLNPQNG